jgi:trans-aconitate methyltransferase
VNQPWRLLSQPRSPGQDGYFEHVRSDLLNLVAAPPSLAVEVGCGTGSTGAELKRRFPAARVEGFEMHAEAAALAAGRLDRVHAGNVEQTDFEALYRPGTIELLLLADVLEHLYDPWLLLERIRPFLAPGAQVLASIPNARNLLLLSDLASGRFTYREAGLLDITHIRFFTHSEIIELFQETGYAVHSMRNVRDPAIPPIAEPAAFPVNLDTPHVTFKNLDAAAFAELQTIQFYVDAAPR